MRKVYQEQTGRSENDSYETIRGTRIKSREGDLKMMMMDDALQHKPVAAVHCSFWLRQGAQGVTLSVRAAQSALKH